MVLRDFYLPDYFRSFFFHGLKAVAAFYINWVVLKQFSASDYATWSITSSIMMVATISDLGIGQYAVTSFINSGTNLRQAITKDCLVALLPLAIAAFIFVFVFISGPSLLYMLTMASFLGLRLLSAPFGALLSAVNKFKIRKAIEMLTYLVSAIVISIIAHRGWDITWALLAINTAFVFGAVATVIVARRYMSISDLLVAKRESSGVMEVYRKSMPFMVSNFVGLFSYAGFIWISSFFLGVNDLSKLALLHTFVLMSHYQFFDIFLKSRQADLIDPKLAMRARRISIFIMAGIPLLFLMFGGEVFQLITNKFQFSQLEVFLFSIFVSLELGFLLIQSLVEVRWDLFERLILFSKARLLCLAVSLVIFKLLPTGAGLTEYIASLLGPSVVGLYLVFRRFDAETKVRLRHL